MSHYQVGHENKSHEYISPMDYDEAEKMRLEQERLTKATSRQIPVRTKQVELPRSESYNSIPKGHPARFNRLDKATKNTIETYALLTPPNLTTSTQSFLDPRGRIPCQLLKGEWNVLNLYWESGVVMQSDHDGYSVGATQERVVNLYGDNETFAKAFDTGVVPTTQFRTTPFETVVVETLPAPQKQQPAPQPTQTVPDSTGPVNFCPSCGAGCKGMKFCGSCGHKLY